MELLSLNNSFVERYPVENYSSLIWTERYYTSGDFELKSSDIARCIQLLPKDSYVTLRDTTVPMIVEDHKIVKAKGKAPEIVVTGRSFETVLERRASVRDAFPQTTTRTPWQFNAAKPSDVAYLVMRYVLGAPALYSTIDGSIILGSQNPGASPLDVIPELVLTAPADLDVVTATNKYVIQPQDLYKTVLELIQTNRRGIKSVRPIGSSHPGTVAVEIYNGADLTSTLSFDAKFGQFDNATYLLSSRGSKNVGYVYGQGGSEIVLKTTAPEPSGLARRVLVVNQASDASANTPEVRKSRGLIELYKNNVTALFDGEIAQQVAAGYNTKYFLGDILKLVGEYGLTSNVRVAEYIRSSDASGTKNFPTFETIE